MRVYTYELDIKELEYGINNLDSLVYHVTIQPKTAHICVKNSSILDCLCVGILSKLLSSII